MKRSRAIRRAYFAKKAKKQAELWFIRLAALAAVAFLVCGVFRALGGDKRSAPKLSDVGAFRVPYAIFRELDRLSVKYKLPLAELLTVCAEDFSFFPDNGNVPDSADLERMYIMGYNKAKSRINDKNANAYEEMLGTILSEMKTFPLPSDYEPDTYAFSDSWGASRLYGGERAHEGTDILDRENVRGRLPVISMTDGAVSGFGWNELGGFHVGVTTASGTYYYYAHLDSFAPDLSKGMEVEPGRLLGYMGDTGYGKEGSRGKFPVHLHVGVCPSVPFTDKEFWINPYPFLRSLEEKRISARLAQE